MIKAMASMMKSAVTTARASATILTAIGAESVATTLALLAASISKRKVSDE